MTRVLTPITHTQVASLLLGSLFARQGAFVHQFQRGLCCAAKKGVGVLVQCASMKDYLGA